MPKTTSKPRAGKAQPRLPKGTPTKGTIHAGEFTDITDDTIVGAPAAARGRGRKTGAVLPPSAPRNAGTSDEALDEQRHVRVAEQAKAHREKFTAKYPEVRHGGFECSSCGSKDWRAHQLATKEGALHATLGLKGCARCGTMHPAHMHALKTDGEPVTVAKSIDSSETALQRDGDGPALVGHRTGCPKGGSAPCGAEVDGRCSLCGTPVRDHQALGKTLPPLAVTIAKLRTLT